MSSLGTPPAHGHPQMPLQLEHLSCLLSAAGKLGSLEQKKDKTQGAHGEEEHPKGRERPGYKPPDA